MIMISLSDIRLLRCLYCLQLSAVETIWKFLLDSASKFLQNSSIIQKTSVILSVIITACFFVITWFSIMKIRKTSGGTTLLNNFLFPNRRICYVIFWWLTRNNQISGNTFMPPLSPVPLFNKFFHVMLYLLINDMNINMCCLDTDMSQHLRHTFHWNIFTEWHCRNVCRKGGKYKHKQM